MDMWRANEGSPRHPIGGNMNELRDYILIFGDRFALTGKGVKVGEKAPDLTLVGNDLAPVSLGSFKGKVLVIVAVTSLDTPVCDIETARFNSEAQKLGDDVKIAAISMDLPFAQARWCGAREAEYVVTLSDHKDAAFAEAFGVMIPDLRLIARSVFIVDREGIVRYIQLGEENTVEPDYDDVLAALSKIV